MSSKVKAKEEDWAKQGYRYWGTGTVVDGQYKGEDLEWMYDVLDKPGTPRQFFFANIAVKPEFLEARGNLPRAPRPLLRDGKPMSVNGDLAPEMRAQLCNIEKIKKGWNPVRDG